MNDPKKETEFEYRQPLLDRNADFKFRETKNSAQSFLFKSAARKGSQLSGRFEKLKTFGVDWLLENLWP